ncbi:TetR family transcriptional regulator [Bacterioplanes sanyensis]|uniref:TetR/AcrR family transcriptional regulator n=1 Tax=Bacterioplanes sanyensis TaxID=1249553 RepID=UPI0016729099|nr:TetR/AcrR family transcriptional regulator [Bacterioplanes sanyensis]GGY49930.1 TetR family transcriptional regulator [Bacterioplanes sanyensis]
MSEMRDQLKTIATEQIRKKTLAAASFRELGKAAGIKSSSVHYHFKSRDALLLELVKDYHRDFFAELKQRCDEVSSPRQRLRTLADMFCDSHANNMQCLCQAYAAGVDGLNDDHRQVVQAFFAELQQWVSDTLANARLLALPRDELAKVIVSALEGSLLLDRGEDEQQRLQATKAWLTTLSSL